VKRLATAGITLALFVLGSGSALAGTGNGVPSGPHYNLNIIGVPKDKTVAPGNNQTIFVPLYGGCKISLSEGPFDVLDGNCTNDGQSAFQLPNPDPGNTGTTVYSVYARALGKPGGSSTTQSCFTDTSTGDEYCSIYQLVETRSTGKSLFTNASQDLLYVYYCDTSTGKIVRDSLFDNPLYDFFWQYTNDGLRLAQLRFYPGVQTTVAPAGAACA
jgi:hypothetical protein